MIFEFFSHPLSHIVLYLDDVHRKTGCFLLMKYFEILLDHYTRRVLTIKSQLLIYYYNIYRLYLKPEPWNITMLSGLIAISVANLLLNSKSAIILFFNLSLALLNEFILLYASIHFSPSPRIRFQRPLPVFGSHESRKAQGFSTPLATIPRSDF